MHAGIALSDAATATADGRLGAAVRSLMRCSVALSLGAALEGAVEIARLARRRAPHGKSAVAGRGGAEALSGETDSLAHGLD